MNIALRNVEIYGPKPLGRCDVFTSGTSVVALERDLPALPSALPHQSVDLSGLIVIPGFIDSHVHITGGGGEAGPGSRVPPLQLSQLTRAGVTTCVGVLGTDGTTRTVRDLVAHTLGLRAHGLSAYCYTGSYQYPVPTLTGSVRDDIVFIDPIIGVGELALSDHRSSQITIDELLRVASDAYAAGLISGKAGVVHLHMGDGERQFDLIENALNTAEIPTRIYHPTHVNRNKPLFEAAKALSHRGITVDVTAFADADGGFLASEAIDVWLQSDLNPSQITCSSDGGGCMPTFDSEGEMICMGIGQSDVLGHTFQDLLKRGHSFDRISAIFSENVARVLRMPKKGRIAPGYDADLIAMDNQGTIRYVMCRGTWMVFDGEVVRRGTFEDDRKAKV